MLSSEQSSRMFVGSAMFLEAPLLAKRTLNVHTTPIVAMSVTLIDIESFPHI